jgi:hypothetical protein
MNISLGMQRPTCFRSHSRGVDRDVVEKSVKSRIGNSTIRKAMIEQTREAEEQNQCSSCISTRRQQNKVCKSLGTGVDDASRMDKMRSDISPLENFCRICCFMNVVCTKDR